MLTIISITLAYFIGSISSSIIICRLFHQPDPRTVGSGNAGATNVLRIAGKKLAILTLLSDIGKGALAVIIGRLLQQNGFALGFTAFFVFIGHLYPIFFQFKGGKGVATGLGSLLILSPFLGIAALSTWLIVAFVYRYSSLASMVTFSLVPIYSLFLADSAYFFPLCCITIFILWKHRKNINRLIKGIENKIGEKIS